MSFAPLAALTLLAAALLGLALPRGSAVVRVLAALGALALLPSAGGAAARPFAALAVGAAVVASPVACLLAAAGAVLVSLQTSSTAGSLLASLDPATASAPPLALVLVGLATGAAAGGLSFTTRERLEAGADPAWPAAVAGLLLSLLLLGLDGGRVLRWSYGLGSGAARLELPGAGLLLGLTLLFALAGALALVAHLLTAAAPVAWARLGGQRLLLMAAALGTLGTGFVLLQGLTQREDALAAGARDGAGLFLATGLLVLGLFVLLGPAGRSDIAPHADRECRVAAVLAVLGAGLAGCEAWLRQGTYATPLVAAAVAAALAGFAALEPTRLVLTRRALFLVGLVFLLV